jgi:glycolate oxidase iron-sulfur subunit
MGENLVRQFPGDTPLIINSAGCGSTIKEYHHLIGTKEAENLVGRTFDLSEFLLNNGFLDLLKTSPGLKNKVTYHDACHLSHGQRITQPPRQLIQAIPGVEYVELPEAELCCGSAGIYNVAQPEMARKLGERKVGNIESTGATLVAMGNPGCHAWIRQVAQEHSGLLEVMHTAELLEAAFVGLEHFR